MAIERALLNHLENALEQGGLPDETKRFDSKVEAKVTLEAPLARQFRDKIRHLLSSETSDFALAARAFDGFPPFNAPEEWVSELKEIVRSVTSEDLRDVNDNALKSIANTSETVVNLTTLFRKIFIFVCSELVGDNGLLTLAAITQLKVNFISDELKAIEASAQRLGDHRKISELSKTKTKIEQALTLAIIAGVVLDVVLMPLIVKVKKELIEPLREDALVRYEQLKLSPVIQYLQKLIKFKNFQIFLDNWIKDIACIKAALANEQEILAKAEKNDRTDFVIATINLYMNRQLTGKEFLDKLSSINRAIMESPEFGKKTSQTLSAHIDTLIKIIPQHMHGIKVEGLLGRYTNLEEKAVPASTLKSHHLQAKAKNLGNDRGGLNILLSLELINSKEIEVMVQNLKLEHSHDAYLVCHLNDIGKKDGLDILHMNDSVKKAQLIEQIRPKIREIIGLRKEPLVADTTPRLITPGRISSTSVSSHPFLSPTSANPSKSSLGMGSSSLFKEKKDLPASPFRFLLQYNCITLEEVEKVLALTGVSKKIHVNNLHAIENELAAIVNEQRPGASRTNSIAKVKNDANELLLLASLRSKVSHSTTLVFRAS